MYCERCHQRPATVHITKILNNVKKETHLCEHCASTEGFLNDAFNFQNLLSGLLDIESTMPNSKPITFLQCSNCGMDYSLFKKYGKLGCDQCYDTFESMVNPLIKRIHGRDRHIGKIVKHGGEKIRMKNEMLDLQRELQQAIDSENFELAVKLRDEIKELNKKVK